MTDADQNFFDESEALEDSLDERVYPILFELEEEYPEHSAFYSMFIGSMHMIFDQGWTKEELLKEVEDHYALFMKTQVDLGEMH